MNFYGIQESLRTPDTIVFLYRCKGGEKELRLAAGPFYRVFFDGELVSYGPERTASGYACLRLLPIPKRTRLLRISLHSYGLASFDCASPALFFGAEIIGEKGVVGEGRSFKASRSSLRGLPTSKFSFQRGFIERFDARNVQEESLHLRPLTPLKLLSGNPDPCHYQTLGPERGPSLPFIGFDEILARPFEKRPELAPYSSYAPEADFQKAIAANFLYEESDFSRVVTGLIEIRVRSEKEGWGLVVFDENKPEGKWIYGRSSCNDLLSFFFPAGESVFLSAVPYDLRYLRAIHAAGVDVHVVLHLIQNDAFVAPIDFPNPRLAAIARAAENTFRQNAVDLFTDCPSRERAGWLCDSYFSAIAERYFTHSSAIEERFLENFILAETPALPPAMLPMCYPAGEIDDTFIPNWALWFVLELANFQAANPSSTFKERAKEKTASLLSYFASFENQEGLLENLPSWVFIEWSKAGEDAYVQGVSFPTNMLYAEALSKASALYGVEEWARKAEHLRLQIQAFSFHNGFYHDNALREKGKLVLQDDHCSETCQYYALLFLRPKDALFAKKMVEEFGPFRKESVHPSIARSAVFMGFYLRFLYLLSVGGNARLLQEADALFSSMALTSGTLWEKEAPTASLNHGFAAAIAPILAAAQGCYQDPAFTKNSF